MALKTPEEYKNSLKDLDLEVYLFGEKLSGDIHRHPIIKPSVNALAKTYDVSLSEELLTAKSHLNDEQINRFVHIHQSTQDLVKKTKMMRLLGRETGTCFQRCVGLDALNALSIVTYKIDQEKGTEFYERFLEYLEYVQENDLACTGAMTDTKGDRSLKPSEQEDPDQYLHVVEEKDNGIVVKGAKAHQTGAVNSHEIIVMPTRRMRKEDEDYAIAFALPSDTEGIKYIYGRQPSDLRKLEDYEFDTGNIKYGGQEALVIFDDVFVPWDRIFMYKDFKFAYDFVEKFASYHRQSYACKSGIGDVMIGATSNIAKYNGVRRKSHVIDKIIEMNHLNETIYACSLASAYEGHEEESGTYYVDTLKTQICKLNVTRFPFQMARLAIDVAGGYVTTLPAEEDFKDDRTRKYLNKYLKGVSDANVEDRVRTIRLIENLTMGAGAGMYLCESVHGAGSPMAQRITINRKVNMDEKEKAAKRIAGIKED